MHNPKLSLIADNLHYPITISEIEKQIISTQIFNRLHNILQNSTVYLTYPANRTTRFIHSLGCMHIAGLMFQNGINNAESDHKNKFLNYALEEINFITQSRTFKEKLKKFIKNEEEEERIREESLLVLNDPIYNLSMPGSLLVDHRFTYKIVFQSLRLHALMHDLGHPPFSHITEKALEDILRGLQEKESRTKREDEFIRIIEPLVGDSLSEVNEDRHLHEQLGKTLENELLDEIIPNCDLKSDNHQKCNCFIRLLVEQFTINIYTKGKVIINHEKKKGGANDEKNINFYKSLYEIISSDLDADRLDYVTRDLCNSGILSHSLNYGRFIYSYQLFYKPTPSRDNEGECDYPIFLPSVRSLSIIEEFYRLRFDLYKYVIFHHRVTKTDGLLRNVIVRLAKLYLEGIDPDKEKSSTKEKSGTNYLLPDNISGLWKVMDPKIYPQEIIHNYIQWDDSWLFSVLRKHFFKYESDNDNELLDPPTQLLRTQLEEILSNRKYYYSLYKRVDTFIPVDEAFLGCIPDDFSWSIMNTKVRDAYNKEGTTQFLNAPDPLLERIATLQMYTDDYKAARAKGKEEVIEKLRETHGFFLSNFVLLIRHSNIADMANFTSQALNELKGLYQLTDAIIITKKIKPGVVSSLPLLVEGEQSHVVHIGSVSRIADDLYRSSLFFPPFFVFTYKEENSENLNIEQMRIDFGFFLWKAFKEWLDNSLRGDQK